MPNTRLSKSGLKSEVLYDLGGKCIEFGGWGYIHGCAADFSRRGEKAENCLLERLLTVGVWENNVCIFEDFKTRFTGWYENSGIKATF